MMIFVFPILFSALQVEEEIEDPHCQREISIGGANTFDHPFWSQPIIGIHTYLIEKPKYRYSMGEDRTVIPLNDRVRNYSTTSRIIDGPELKQFEKFIGKEIYNNIYIGDIVKRFSLLNTTSTAKYFSNITFIIQENYPKCSEYSFELRASNPIEIKKGDSININYSVAYENFVPKATIILDDEMTVRILCYVLLFISICVAFGFSFILSRGDKIPFSDVWRVPNSFANSSVFVYAGCFILFYVYLALYICKDYLFFKMAEQMVLPALVFPLIIQILFGNILYFKGDVQDLIVDSMIFAGFFLTPMHICIVLSSLITGSWRGRGILGTFINDAVLITISSLECFCFGELLKLYRIPIRVDNTNEETNLPRGKRSVFEYLHTVISILTTLFIGKRLSSQLIDYVFLNEINMYMVGIHIGIFFCAHYIIGCLWGYLRLKKLSTSWMSSHDIAGIYSAVVFIAAFLIEAIPHCHYLDMYLYAGIFSFVLFIAVLCFVAFASFSGAASVAFLTYSEKEKIN